LAPFADFSPIFAISQKSLKFRHFRHIHYENENAKIVLNFLDFSTILAC
jgi:hypothetical protein